MPLRYQIYQNPWKIWLCIHNYGTDKRFSPRQNFWVSLDYRGDGSLGGCRVLRTSRDRFFRISPNCIFGSRNAYFEKKIGPYSRSVDATTLSCLRPPQTKFSECHRISYLYPKILFLNWEKKFGTRVGRSATFACLGSLRTNL